MTAASPSLTSLAPVRGRSRGQSLVRLWLWAVALMVLAMVVVGGATRLTDSGLSITEWQPLLGAFPPLTEDAWQAAFAAYREIPQYKLVNAGMTLDAFKAIFWWEWAHRFLGRAVGVVFLIPFLAFIGSGNIGRREIPSFFGLFLLGGLQGAIGWWMVSSGLSERVDVAPYRLAIHLIVASAIFAIAVWMAERRSGEPREAAACGLSFGANLLIAVIFVQVFLGALVAGNDAGLVYNTWPLMDGRFYPAEATALSPVWVNFFENHAMVQFMHRTGAYLVFVVAIIHGFRVAAFGTTETGRVSGLLVILGVVLQAGVGIATLLLQVPIALALVHQALAIVVLGIAVVHRTRLA